MSIGEVVDITREPLLTRIAELEGDLRRAESQLQRIDEVLVGSYGDIPRLSAGDARRMLRSIANIVNPF
jgi:hypothetical protein